MVTLPFCGAKGTRTPDPHTASVVRYQLRHSPVLRFRVTLRLLERSYTIVADSNKSAAQGACGGSGHIS
jgi:hypothetical protein